MKAFERFRKKQSKGIVDVSAEYRHNLVESRPHERPRKDGTSSAVPTGGPWTSSGMSIPRRPRVCAVAKDTSCS